MILLGLTVAVPLLLLLACLSPRVRPQMTSWLVIAPLPGLAAALLAVDATLDLPPLLLRLRLGLDRPSAMLLGAAALLWAAGGMYAATWLRDDPRRGRIAVWWLLTLTGSLGVFIAVDLVSFYLLFSMVSLAAYGLVIEGTTPDAPRAGLIYVAMAVFGEALLLLGFVMLAMTAPQDGLLIRDAVAALPDAGRRNAILALLILGFGVKLGMLPFQFWMPLTYRTAPIPAAAMLSGAAVKAGVVGLIRFLPLETAIPFWGQALLVLGFASAFHGALAGLRRADPRAVLAYSSISQMGVVAAVFGMGLAIGEPAAALAAAFYGAHHTLVKGGLFLGVGIARRAGGTGLWLVMVPTAILALGMAGLPLTGGYLAKLAIKPLLGDGVAGGLGILSSLATATLMTHFLFRVAALAPAVSPARVPMGLWATWLLVAAATAAVPWAIYLAGMDGMGPDALSVGGAAGALWPVVAGAALGLALQRWHRRPLLEHEDVAALAAATGLRSLASLIGAAGERVDARFRDWPVALLSLLITSVVLAALMWAGR